MQGKNEDLEKKLGSRFLQSVCAKCHYIGLIISLDILWCVHINFKWFWYPLVNTYVLPTGKTTIPARTQIIVISTCL